VKSSEWEQILMPSPASHCVWELFHENSKTSRYDVPPTDEDVLAAMNYMWQSLPFTGYSVVELPTERSPFKISLADAITTRVTARNLAPSPLSLQDLSALLFYAYGVSRDNADNGFPRPFRVVPSAGALYPLELFFHTAVVDGLEAGLYHYHPLENVIRLVHKGDVTKSIQDALVQPEVVVNSSLILFVTAVFERSTFKYGDRGYRFVLLEAGHLAQNVNLIANGLGLGCVNLGGFFDRRVDDLLDLDGLTHSTIYLAAIGRNAAPAVQD
jgi:SagB-type dehydrogenase family enzyme